MKTENNKVSTFSQVLLWFGAAVSIAEILTGSLLAPLGLGQGVLSIFIGHVIGAVILFLAGLIGAKSGFSAAESARISFGKYGSFGFSILNILQLLGWTAIMIINGATALDGVTGRLWGYENEKLWCVLIGLLIILWVAVGVKNLSKVNVVVVTALFLLTLILGFTVFKGAGTGAPVEETMTFGGAVELNVAMSLSWLPLISDYTKDARKPRAASAVSAAVYFLTGCWMYIIGLGAALFTGESDIAQIMVTAGLGIIAVLIVILSTVTTTFLDVYSAGVSFRTVTNRIPEKAVSIAVCVLGTLLAIFTPITEYENFLYLIGSVFAPMISILIVDYFILRQKHDREPLNRTNAVLWLVGFCVYRLFLSVDTVIGSTFPVMLITALLCVLVHQIRRRFPV